MKTLIKITALFALVVVSAFGSGTTLGPTNWYDVITTTVTYTFSPGSPGTVSWEVVNSAPGYTGGGNYDVAINGIVVANYGGGGPSGPYNSTQSGSAPANPGDSIVAISTLHFAWTIPLVETDCKAKVDIKNPYAVPTYFKVNHTIDGELGRVLLQPGQAWTQEWTVTCGGTFTLSYQMQGDKGDDIWFVPDPSTPANESGWTGSGAPPTEDGDPAAPAPTVPPPPSPKEAGLPSAGSSPGVPWKPRDPSAPGDTSNLLDRDTYREGVNKIKDSIDELKPYDEATAKTAFEAAADAALASATAAATAANAALPSTINSASEHSNAQAGSDEALYTATVPGIAAQKLLGSNSIAFKPGEIVPGWKTLGGWLREAILITLAISFLFFTQGKFEQYYLVYWQISEKTTKQEPAQITVPGIGWSKQLGTTLALTAAFVAAIAAVITFTNSNIGDLVGSGVTIQSGMSSLGARLGDVWEGVGVIYSFMNVFLPIAAAFQFLAVHYTISWLVAPLWGLAYAIAKYFHV